MPADRSFNPEHPPNANAPASETSKPTVSLDQTATHDAGKAKSSSRQDAADLPKHPHYEITHELARGGMGRVLAGREIALDREVAIKTLLPGADAARFMTEAKITARLPDPGIPPVHALGTLADQSPFLAMKLVRGLTLSEALNSRVNLAADLPRFVQIFEQVAQAVGFAHAQGIIHRDLKPSNVMVGDFGEVQVMDWGLARDERSNLPEGDDVEMNWASDEIHRTQKGAVIGTPSYMAPEQARGEVVDERADVFALGGILAAILTGQPPFRGTTVQETVALAAAGDTQQINKRLDRVTKDKGADKELVEIARRCLAADSADRPKNGEEVAELVATYRAGVEQRLRQAEADRAASDAKAAEVLKRRQVVRVAAGIVVGVLVLGIIGTTWQALRANDQRNKAIDARNAESEQRKAAEIQRDKATTIAFYMGDILRGAKTSVALGRDITMLKEMLERAANRINSGSLKDAPEAELELRGTIGDTMIDLALFDDAQELIEPAVAMARTLYPGDHADKAVILNTMGHLLKTRGRWAESEPFFRESIAMERRLASSDTSHLATALNNLAIVRQDLGDLAGSEPYYRESLELRQKLYPGDHEDVAVSLNSMSRMFFAQKDIPASEDYLLKSLEMQRRLFPGDHPDIAVDLEDLGTLHRESGDLAGAEKYYRESLTMMQRLYPGDHNILAAGMNNLARVLRARGDVDGAEPYIREALAMKRRLFPGDHAEVAISLSGLAILLTSRGEFGEAETLFRESLEMNRRLFPGDHAGVSADLNNVAFVLFAQGDAAGAETFARESVEMSERLVGKDAFATANARLKLGQSLVSLERFPEAEAELLETERVFSAIAGVPPPKQKQCLSELQKLYEAWDAVEPSQGHDVSAAKWKAKIGQ